MPAAFRFWGRVLGYMRGLGIPVYEGVLPRPLPSRRLIRLEVNVLAGFAGVTRVDTITGAVIAVPEDEVWSIEYADVEDDFLSTDDSYSNLMVIFPQAAINDMQACVASTYWGNAPRVGGFNLANRQVQRVGRRLLEPGDTFEIQAFNGGVAANDVRAYVAVYRWPRGMAPYLNG